MKKTTVWFFFNTDSLSPRYSKRLGEKCFVSRICQIKLDIAAAAVGVGAIANRILLARWHEVQSSIGNSRESFIHKSHTCLNTWRGTFFHGYWLLREKWIWERLLEPASNDNLHCILKNTYWCVREYDTGYIFSP